MAKAEGLTSISRLDEISPAFDAVKSASIVCRFIGLNVRKVHCRPAFRALWVWKPELGWSGLVLLHLYVLLCAPAPNV